MADILHSEHASRALRNTSTLVRSNDVEETGRTRDAGAWPRTQAIVTRRVAFVAGHVGCVSVEANWAGLNAGLPEQVVGTLAVQTAILIAGVAGENALQAISAGLVVFRGANCHALLQVEIGVVQKKFRGVAANAVVISGTDTGRAGLVAEFAVV